MIRQSLLPLYDPYKDVAKDYDGFYNKAIVAAEDSLVRDWLRRWKVGVGTVYDAGCGTGWLLDQISVKQGHYCGVDFSPAMLLRLLEKFPARADEVRIGDISRPCRPEAWDSVVCLFGALNETSDPQAIFSHMITKARRHGGRVIAGFLGLQKARRGPSAAEAIGPPDYREYPLSAVQIREIIRREALRVRLREWRSLNAATYRLFPESTTVFKAVLKAESFLAPLRRDSFIYHVLYFERL